MGNVKMYITVDELYPFYDLSKETYPLPSIKAVEVSEEFYEEYIKISQSFSKIQEKIEEMYHGNKK